MDRPTFRAFLDAMIEDVTPRAIIEFANKMAVKYGYRDWLDAYKNLPPAEYTWLNN